MADVSLADLRKEYRLRGLAEADVERDPLRQFQRWFDEALAAALPEPNAMTLATVSAQGKPSARMVLLKGFDAAGFVFFSNYESRKGGELAARPEAALVFYWAELERQVRIEGRVERTTAEESDAYFHSRPVGSQIGAIASHQSSVLANRQELEARSAALDEAYQGQTVPRPAFWGGYRVVPEVYEFWQGRPSRLHDRLRYRRASGEGAWIIERLSP